MTLTLYALIIQCMTTGAARKRKPARGASGTVAFSARLPRDTTEGLKQYARENRVSTSAAAAQFIEEGLRMARFPGIDFRWAPSGRKPCVTGTGLSVWELFHLCEAFGENVERLLKHYPHLTAAKVNAGIAYARAYLDEMPRGDWGVKPPFAREVKV